ncbi:uncharacterized protein LOC127794181 [Diospyros lotus]|uniref:uncharacterized protein LOC127794181 n=1 Tax=Diospyros lotus TaxID=55363 RepID=UPI00224EE3E2|nr:uncharacterized protein LOC127794181 [Diospyros lotus]
MAASSKPSEAESPLYYHPLPPDHHHPHPHQDYFVLPLYFPASGRRRLRRRIISAVSFLLLAVAAYCLWPSDPDIKIVRLHLDRLHIRTNPAIAVDIVLRLTVKVRNVGLYSTDYRSLVVSIGYRGKQLGFMKSDRGFVRPRGSSYVDAVLELDGVEVLSDAILLLEDLARGSVPFDTVTEIRGQLGLFFFELPLKAKVSCEVYVNTRNQTIIRQNCYPE